MTLAEWVTKLEDQKAEMLGRLEDWPEERLAARPAAGEWSVVEVLDHVVRVESGICGAAREMMLAPAKVGPRDRLGFRIVEKIFLSQRRVKVPRSVHRVAMPGEDLALADVVVRWDEARVRVRDLAEEATARAVEGGVFRHPISGWMTVEQVFRFFSVHIVHHEFQVERIRRALNGG